MNIHIDTIGHGPDLVMVHGWGLDSGVFDPLRERLAPRHRLHLVDLPGFGRSRDVEPPEDMAVLAQTLIGIVPPGAGWLGWSLGAQVALHAARIAPARIHRLMLVAATPCFVARPDWPTAMSPETFSAFAGGLSSDWRGTLNRFIGLLAADPLSDRDMLRRLRECLLSSGEPSPAALARGLQWLRENDLRSWLPAVGMPTLLIQGERDRLVPPGAAAATASLLPAARTVLIKAAGHAPFLSRPADFMSHLDAFTAEAA